VHIRSEWRIINFSYRVVKCKIVSGSSGIFRTRLESCGFASLSPIIKYVSTEKKNVRIFTVYFLFLFKCNIMSLNRQLLLLFSTVNKLYKLFHRSETSTFFFFYAVVDFTRFYLHHYHAAYCTIIIALPFFWLFCVLRSAL